MRLKSLFAATLFLCCAIGVQASAYVQERSTQFEVISDNDWRSTNPDIPWSEPVIVRDDFTGDYLAVFDRNFVDRRFTEEGVISNWSREYIRIFVYYKQRRCGAIPVFCNTLNTEMFEANRLEVKIDEQVFAIEGEDGNFPVSEELATALANAPSGEARIRIRLEGSGALITNDIGEDTVSAWRSVYSN